MACIAEEGERYIKYYANITSQIGLIKNWTNWVCSSQRLVLWKSATIFKIWKLSKRKFSGKFYYKIMAKRTNQSASAN